MPYSRRTEPPTTSESSIWPAGRWEPSGPACQFHDGSDHRILRDHLFPSNSDHSNAPGPNSGRDQHNTTAIWPPSEPDMLAEITITNTITRLHTTNAHAHAISAHGVTTTIPAYIPLP